MYTPHMLLLITIVCLATIIINAQMGHGLINYII